MNNKELLFNLVKKLASKEDDKIKGLINIDNHIVEFKLIDTKSQQEITLAYVVNSNGKKYVDYEVNWNQAFAEKFYQKKGLDKCWYKDCFNKIFKGIVPVYSQTAKDKVVVDYKTTNVRCQDKYQHNICWDCYTTKNHE